MWTTNQVTNDMHPNIGFLVTAWSSIVTHLSFCIIQYIDCRKFSHLYVSSTWTILATWLCFPTSDSTSWNDREVDIVILDDTLLPYTTHLLSINKYAGQITAIYRSAYILETEIIAHFFHLPVRVTCLFVYY